MTDLKGELASLKIDRARARSSAWRWPLLLLLPVVIALVGFYGWRAQRAFSAPEVETTTAAVTRDVLPSAGTPVLTASGYVVARRKAVVSAKIQGRLSELRVEEGSVVRAGEVLARLENPDYEASVDARARRSGRADARSARRPLPCSAPAPTSPKRSGSSARRAALEGRAAPTDSLMPRSRVASRPPRRPGHGRRPARAQRPQSDADLRLQRSAAAEHAHPRTFRRRRGAEDGRGRRERRADSAGREHLHRFGRDRRARGPRDARSGGGRGRGERGEGRGWPARGGDGRGDPRPALQGRAAAGDSDG